MSAGRDMQVKIKNDLGAFALFAGLQTRSLHFQASLVEATNLESENQWRELLPGAGVKSADITGTGLFVNSASAALARSIFFEQSLRNYQFILPEFGTIEGAFLISQLAYKGTYQGEASYELTLLSAGAPIFTPII